MVNFRKLLIAMNILGVYMGGFSYNQNILWLNKVTFSDGSVHLLSIMYDSLTTSDVFQPTQFFINSRHGINWSRSQICLLESDRTLFYPNPHPYGWCFFSPCNLIGHWPDSMWNYPGNREAYAEASAKLCLQYTSHLDTLSDTSWVLTITPTGRDSTTFYSLFPRWITYNPCDFLIGDTLENTLCFTCGFYFDVYDIYHHFRWHYDGPLLISLTSDTLSPGFGRDVYWYTNIVDTLGEIVYVSVLNENFSVDYSGPCASKPYPADKETISILQPNIRITILDTFSIDPRVLFPGMQNQCRCLTPDCVDSTGAYIKPPYCLEFGTIGGFVDSSTILLSVNGRVFTFGDPGTKWEPDTIHISPPVRILNSMFTLNTAEAGLTFSPGETVHVCLLEATDVVRGGYGPNHLGRYRDWTHPDTPIPYCWEFYISPTAVAETETKPTQMQLLVYPNPSNQTVRLVYIIPDNKSNTSVELTIHNILGRKVATLFSGQKSPGHHETSWDTNDQPSGIYFASLKARQETIIQRIILVK